LSRHIAWFVGLWAAGFACVVLAAALLKWLFGLILKS
jgi:hypothetical protein